MANNAQINVSVTNPTIADVFERLSDGKLDLQPDFQRKFVWTQDHQEEFIDTILHGFPFPEIYVCQGEYDAKNFRTSQEVIDGQQRLTTIKRYIENKFDKPLKKVPIFDELGGDMQKQFMSYKLVVRDIGEVEQATVREIFRRINLTKFKLEDIEIQNAIYDGQFISAAKHIAKNISLEQFGVFHESEFTRMVDVYFVLQVMATYERNGYFNRDSEIEKCVAEFNDEYPNSAEISKKLIELIQVIESIGLEPDSIWFRKSNFFTLVMELLWAEDISEDIARRLNEMDVAVIKHKYSPESELGTYYSYMYQGTNNRKARVIRGEIFKKHILA
ncbi:MAG: DUF262 domain-containing protein [Lentilitoribacter sp.]|uniref:DUF262 domain-containing protein n=1 Tax=Hyphomonas sp. TaxID=87 RepID=UPI00328A5C29